MLNVYMLSPGRCHVLVKSVPQEQGPLCPKDKVVRSASSGLSQLCHTRFFRQGVSMRTVPSG